MTDDEVQARIDEKTGPKVTADHLESIITGQRFFHHNTLTICVLELKNGFTVTGESACADPANYDEELVRQLARINAFNKLWALEGYLLRQRMFEALFDSAR